MPAWLTAVLAFLGIIPKAAEDAQAKRALDTSAGIRAEAEADARKPPESN